jgi:hypothetical protein
MLEMMMAWENLIQPDNIFDMACDSIAATLADITVQSAQTGDKVRPPDNRPDIRSIMTLPCRRARGSPSQTYGDELAIRHKKYQVLYFQLN